ncbi:hypothetical protein AN1V17_22630 [Vallitalea sediminicola]
MRNYNHKLINDSIIVIVCFILFVYLFGIKCLIAFVPVIGGVLVVILFIKFLQLFI